MTITIKKIRPYAKALLLLGLIGAAAYVFFFLENDFYPALTGSETISALQKNISSQTVDINKFNDLVDKISQRASSSPPASFPANPFR
jgi:hypothetical protein